MSARRVALGLVLLAGCVVILSCGVHSPLTVEITIPITASDLSTSADHTPVGFVQGYVFTPSGEGGSGSLAPVISQSPKPVAGSEVTGASVVVSIPGVSSASTRLDQGGYFGFRGYATDSAPITVLTEFPGGGYPDFTSDVPIVPRDLAGLALQQVDLDETTQYQNNASDIRSMSGCRMNFTITAWQAGRFRLFASARGDRTQEDLVSGEDAHTLLDWDMLAGESRTITDQTPYDEGGLLPSRRRATGTGCSTSTC
jgi:hypothetical protein